MKARTSLLSVLCALSFATAFGGCRAQEPDDSQHRQARENGAETPTAMAQGTDRGATPTEGVAAGEAPSAMDQGGRFAAPPPSEPAAEPPANGPRHPALLDPSQATAQAPAQYTVRFDTTKGEVLIDVTRSWAPIGADRFYNLVRIGYFNDVAFFRVIEGFMAQVGLNGDPAVNAAWRMARIQDDPPTQSNTRGMVSFATSGRNSRVQQFFINFGNNARLDGMGFAPFGQVRDMTPVDALYNGYGEGAPGGRGPSQGRIQHEGNTYLRASFPELDYIRSATIVDSE